MRGYFCFRFFSSSNCSSLPQLAFLGAAAMAKKPSKKAVKAEALAKKTKRQSKLASDIDWANKFLGVNETSEYVCVKCNFTCADDLLEFELSEGLRVGVRVVHASLDAESGYV